MLALFLVLGASLNAQEVVTPAQPVQTVSQTACGSYTVAYYDSNAGMWSQWLCFDVYVDESGFFPVVHFQIATTGEWCRETIYWGDDYEIIDNGDGMKSGHAGQAGPGVAVDNFKPFLLTYDAQGNPDQVILLLYAYHHYGPDGNIDGWIIQREAGDPWEIVPYTSVWLLKD